MKNLRPSKRLSAPLLFLTFCAIIPVSVQAAPSVLNDSTLDQVTAGSRLTTASGGAIIRDNSAGVINQTGAVDLSGGAQSGATALNIVNSAKSTVGNGVNIVDVGQFNERGWSNRGPRGHHTPLFVNQNNNINQEQGRLASMPTHSGPELLPLFRSPFELNSAQAEYIVVNDSRLAVTTNSTLSLSGTAQSNLTAMNAVNATGSAVANGVNVARTGMLSGVNLLALNQSNVINQSR